MAYRRSKTTDPTGTDPDDDRDSTPYSESDDSASERVLRDRYGGTDDTEDGDEDESAASGVLRDRYGRFQSPDEG
jgi:hypothetical protein